MLKCWKHYFLLWWSGCCLNVSIGQYVLASCRLWWWVLLGLEKPPREGKPPSWFGSPMVNCICGSCELMCCSNCWLCFASWVAKVSSTYHSHRWGVWGRAKGLDFELFIKHVGNEGANGGTHGSTMDLFLKLTLEEKVCVFEAGTINLKIVGSYTDLNAHTSTVQRITQENQAEP